MGRSRAQWSVGLPCFSRSTSSAAVTQLAYNALASVTRHLITGLTPGAAYTVQTSTVSGGLRVFLQPGGTQTADSGGVLLIGNSPTVAVAVYLPSVTRLCCTARQASP